MFIYGNKKACIATHSDYSQPCPKCKSFTIQYKVYREYVHVFWIPVFSSGSKTCVMSCTACGFVNEYSSKSDSYIGITRTPVYLYSGLILLAIFIFSMCFANIHTQKEKKLFVDSPNVNDVYLIYNDDNAARDSTYYYFLKVNRIQEDSVFAFRNMYNYPRFVYALDSTDAFIQYEYGFSKSTLKTMLEKSEIISVDREYGPESNFNRTVLVLSDSLQ